MDRQVYLVFLEKWDHVAFQVPGVLMVCLVLQVYLVQKDRLVLKVTKVLKAPLGHLE